MVLIGKAPVGIGHLAAEMAWSHDDSLEKTNLIIDGAAANAINVHVTHLASYTVPFYGFGPERISSGRDVADVNLSFRHDRAMTERAKQKDLAVSCMLSNPESCRFVEALDADLLAKSCSATMSVYKRADAGLLPEQVVPLLDKARLAKSVEENAPLNWRYFAPLDSKPA